MTLRKKIFGSIFILAVLSMIVGGYYYFFVIRQASEKSALEGPPDIPEIDLSFSPIENVSLPEVDINLDFDFSNFEMGVPTTSIEDFIQIENPKIDIAVSGGLSSFDFEGSQHGSIALPSPTESVCQQFRAAPSCSFVPSQYRDLCEQCKNKGY